MYRGAMPGAALVTSIKALLEFALIFLLQLEAKASSKTKARRPKFRCVVFILTGPGKL
jgi:hypothetical protein